MNKNIYLKNILLALIIFFLLTFVALNYGNYQLKWFGAPRLRDVFNNTPLSLEKGGKASSRISVLTRLSGIWRVIEKSNP